MRCPPAVVAAMCGSSGTRAFAVACLLWARAAGGVAAEPPFADTPAAERLRAAARVAVVGDSRVYDDDWVANLVGWMERRGTAAHVIDLRLPGGTAAASTAGSAAAFAAVLGLVRPDAVLDCASPGGTADLRRAAEDARAAFVALPRPPEGSAADRPAPADDVAAFLPEVTARLGLLRAAYLAAAGLAPAAAPAAPSLADAEARAAAITASIRSRRLELMGHLDRNGVWQMPIDWPRPRDVNPGPAPAAAAPVPADAVVLFDGRDLAAWQGAEHWTVADGVATVGKGSIKTRQAFGDCQVHVEFRTPAPPSGRGQGRGNSGVIFMDLYEIQLLDSFADGTEATLTYPTGQCAALYKLQPPAVNACRPPGEWQSLDILFTRPRFRAEGSLASHGRVSVLHNGVAVHLDTVIKGTKPWHGPPVPVPHPDALPITIQDHGNPLQFRSIWARPFAPLEPVQR